MSSNRLQIHLWQTVSYVTFFYTLLRPTYRATNIFTTKTKIYKKTTLKPVLPRHGHLFSCRVPAANPPTQAPSLLSVPSPYYLRWSFPGRLEARPGDGPVTVPSVVGESAGSPPPRLL
jgi:hypothetical protein